MPETMHSGTSSGLPADPVAYGSGHVLHGLHLIVHVAGIDREFVAEYLRSMAGDIERDAPLLPMLFGEGF